MSLIMKEKIIVGPLKNRLREASPTLFRKIMLCRCGTNEEQLAFFKLAIPPIITLVKAKPALLGSANQAFVLGEEISKWFDMGGIDEESYLIRIGVISHVMNTLDPLG